MSELSNSDVLNSTQPPPEVTVVAALVQENGRYLVDRRPAGKARAGLWEFIGGKVEPGETDAAALQRECREEVAALIEVGALACQLTHHYPDLTVRLKVYHCKLGSAVQAQEGQQLCWATIAELNTLPFCPADKPLIRQLTELAAPRQAGLTRAEDSSDET
ncbi:MAG: (deoxy)nucleoside triphosphate pyrophosphohydrolase [Oscillospiraceae bacterium]|nr:(deoxy)nucleoside triphosphate pyrophosphohydrolase [Oscillospiraceae bacterium]MDD4367574.1 (deoxy)nucleoside triphosphate pyrophosphohydrolase [Oscillospiraceae bacterium]